MELILAHLTGDYLLQGKHMALTKAEKGFEGFKTCFRHCFRYTAAVCFFMWTLDPVIIWLVFMTHWIVDRHSLAWVWLKLIKGRTFEGAVAQEGVAREFDVGFTCLVYAVVDNTFHLISLWLIFEVFG